MEIAILTMLLLDKKQAPLKPLFNSHARSMKVSGNSFANLYMYPLSKLFFSPCVSYLSNIFDYLINLSFFLPAIEFFYLHSVYDINLVHSNRNFLHTRGCNFPLSISILLTRKDNNGQEMSLVSSLFIAWS